MGFPQTFHSPKLPPRVGPILRLSTLIPILVGMAFIVGPIAYWTGAYLPSWFQTDEMDWPNADIILLIIGLVIALIGIPAVWVWRSRVLDILALTLTQNALIFCGYFYLETTAAHITGSMTGILKLAGLAVIINAVGFVVFFAALFVSYQAAVRFRGRLAALPHAPEILDRRLRWLLTGMSFVCMAMIILPMVLTHTVPLFQGKEARIAMDTSDTGRALYNLGTTFLPFIVGGLAIVVLRGWKIFPRWEVILIFLLIVIQLLTTNRYPISLALLVTFNLISMERRWPRWLMAGILIGYMVLFSSLSGFSEILRIDPQSLTLSNVLPMSLRQAFLGDNIIDLRDFSWVLSHWDFNPFMGKTYLGGLFSFIPTGIFPERKEWHLGLNAIHIVGWPEDAHFGLRITFFGEAFMNFGMAGVVGLALALGALFGVALRRIHLAAAAGAPCLYRNLCLLMTVQLLMPLANTSDAFYFWGLTSFYFLIWLTVVFPAVRFRRRPQAGLR